MKAGEWSEYGHVAIRVYDGSGKNKYDKAYDYGRYGKASGLKGEGILNVQNGKEYIKRESKDRDSVSYIIKTDAHTDKEIMKYYAEQINNGKSRKDIEKRLNYSNSNTYQLKDDYDVAPFTGIGRHTCVSTSCAGLKASDDDNLKPVEKALEELQPKNVEKNMEKLFEKPDSPLVERRIYRKSKPNSPIKITHEDHQKDIESDTSLTKLEDESRAKAWKKQETK